MGWIVTGDSEKSRLNSTHLHDFFRIPPRFQTCGFVRRTSFEFFPHATEPGACLMSDAHSHESTSTELFDKSELAEFVAADQSAGRTICKMLSALFIYTLIAMSIASGWTYYAIMSS
jgi:hypothetical protein